MRNDSDALYSHFGIKLAGVQDLQLMELATRSFPRRRVNGLARCIENDAPMTAAERQRWKATKQKGVDLFAPERGGSYEVFNVRPLAEDIIQYCVEDVRLLPSVTNKATTGSRDVIGKDHWVSTHEAYYRSAVKKTKDHVTNNIPRICQEPTKGIRNIP